MLKPGDLVETFSDTKLWYNVEDVGRVPCDMYATRGGALVIVVEENEWRHVRLMILVEDTLAWTHPVQVGIGETVAAAR